MAAKKTEASETAPESGSAGKACDADRMQRRHCVYYHEKTGRCTQSPPITWQERVRQGGTAEPPQEG